MRLRTYEGNGVRLSKRTSLYSGDKLKISYNGILVQAGAECIYLYCGYGSDWSDSSYTQMYREADGFSAEIQVLDGKSLELCFKDPADNWDNNSGNNYVYVILPQKKKKSGKLQTEKDNSVEEKKSIQAEVITKAPGTKYGKAKESTPKRKR